MPIKAYSYSWVGITTAFSVHEATKNILIFRYVFNNSNVSNKILKPCCINNCGANAPLIPLFLGKSSTHFTNCKHLTINRHPKAATIFRKDICPPL